MHNLQILRRKYCSTQTISDYALVRKYFKIKKRYCEILPRNADSDDKDWSLDPGS